MFKDTIQFIREIYGVKNDFIPLHQPCFTGNEKKYLTDCIDSTFVSSVGKFVDLFEEKIQTFTGAKHAIATVNGTTALQIALQLAGVKPGDEVLTTALTFVATANAISYTGAKIIFTDSSKETLGLCPEKLLAYLKAETEIKKDGFCYNKKTKKRISACVPVHIYGHPADIESILSICNEYNITVIEDAAESLGGYYKNKHTGTFGKLATLSYNGNKIVTTGGGGMLLTNDAEVAKKAKHITTTAKVPHPYEFYHDELGYNFRMPNINAALGVAQMEKLPEFLKSKRELATVYADFFKKLGIDFFTEKKGYTSNYWLNSIFLKDRKERDEFLEYSNKNGVMTRPAWVLMNKLPMYKNYETGGLENAQWIEDRLVNIPSSVRIK